MPSTQGGKWKGEQVGDRKDYKRASKMHNDKAEDYHRWYMDEHQKKSNSDPTSTATGVNKLSPSTNQRGFAMCANVTEKAETETQKRATFNDKWTRAWSNQHQKDGHIYAEEFAIRSAVEHKEQGRKHHRASHGEEVEYPPGHVLKNWRLETRDELKAAAIEKERARKAKAIEAVPKDDNFKIVKHQQKRKGRP